jgi:hypothetical protein
MSERWKVGIARQDDGSRFTSYSAVGGGAAGRSFRVPWQPKSTNSAGDAAVSFGYAIAERAGIVVREFSPKAARKDPEVRELTISVVVNGSTDGSVPFVLGIGGISDSERNSCGNRRPSRPEAGGCGYEQRLLQWRQIDFGRRVITVGESKTDAGEGRTLPLSRLAHETL